MTLFLLACVGLIVLSGLFYLLPRNSDKRAVGNNADANLDWYRLRQTELQPEELESLETDMALRLLEDDRPEQAVTSSSELESSFPRWLLLPLIAIAAGSLYHYLGAAPDVIIQKQMHSISDSTDPEQLQDLFKAIEARSEQRPGNVHYMALLGRFYMDQEDYKQAAQLYSALADESPGDSQALAYAAQAEYLAQGRNLTQRAQLFAEQALAIDPGQKTALGLLGMVLFEQKQYRAAIEYWQRLVATEPAGSASAKMIEGVMAQARQRLAASGEPVVAAAQPGEVVTLGVTVNVRFPDDAQVNAQDTVFVLARAADATSRMPVAVVRLQASQLPMDVRLDDSKSMAGQKLSSLDAIAVVVQVSPEGRPGEDSATWLGSAGPLSPSLDTQAIVVKLAARKR
ncbi:MAG: cytochrome c-type biogenesis protein CcmH [Halioglobus sp.]